MATPNVGILTTAGKALIDKVNSGQAKISFSKVVFSSMDNSQLPDMQVKALTAIAPQEVVVSSPETTLDTNSGETRIRATGTNEKLADGVYVKTYGVFAKDDTDNEILYGVTVSPNPNYFPAYDGVTPQAVTYSYKTVIQETSNITMTNSNDVYVSQEDLDEALKPLPKDDSVVHLTDNETIAGTKTFDTAPVDQKSGLPYITKAGVPEVPATLADTAKDTNFQKALQVQGVDVATAADLKSIEASAWRQLDNQYVSADGYAVSPDTVILYKIEEDSKRLYLQGTIKMIDNNSSIPTVSIALTSIVKTILTVSGGYLGFPDGYASSNGYIYHNFLMSAEGITLKTNSVGIAVILYSPYITYDELI